MRSIRRMTKRFSAGSADDCRTDTVNVTLAFGADIYQWGYQAGQQAAHYLKTHSTAGLQPEMVKIRKRVYNPNAAKRFNITIPPNFEAVK